MQRDIVRYITFDGDQWSLRGTERCSQSRPRSGPWRSFSSILCSCVLDSSCTQAKKDTRLHKETFKKLGQIGLKRRTPSLVHVQDRQGVTSFVSRSSIETPSTRQVVVSLHGSRSISLISSQFMRLFLKIDLFSLNPLQQRIKDNWHGVVRQLEDVRLHLLHHRNMTAQNLSQWCFSEFR